ncbi:uncharacterized protein N7473_009647 [Penicillium subrubescens]|uniref:uncharacterized protein n=1 Tax=Penicillium subrubescens TaxID=1316194 RepID=UPI002545A490|nr:uncharacterized protein N7473_009647 [Penicillium subrubescens]KAJ5886973.1 hypothetical protein N7473_009647 [Penicillium subrubescens]
MNRITTIPVPATIQRTGSPIWRFFKEQESEIVNLAAQCQLKQQQREPLDVVLPDDEAECDSDDDDDLSTVFPAQLTTDGTKQIKTEFLDRLAEIEDQVMIVIARNAKWVEEDKVFLNKLVDLMEMISRGPSQQDHVHVVRELLANYYHARLQHHAEKLKKLVKHVDPHIKAVLLWCCGKFLSKTVSPLEFVEFMGSLSQHKEYAPQPNWVNDKLGPKQIQRINLEMAFICRPEIAANTFFAVARDVPSFQKIHIQLLIGYKPRKIPQKLTTTVKSSTTNKEKNLRAQPAEPRWVHAEIRMITYLLNRENNNQLFTYLGISKKMCFLCGHVVRKLGMFYTRANHGKMYSLWTLPPVLVIKDAYIQRWEPVVNHLLQVLRTEVSRQDLPHMDAARESTMTTPIVKVAKVDDPFASSSQDLRQRERESKWFSMSSRRPEAPVTESNEYRSPPPSDAESDEACQSGDQLPAEENVLKAFGFFHFGSGRERFQLFQTYRKLILHGVTVEEIREAWQKNMLKEFIVSRCAQLPPSLLGSERVWVGHTEGFARDSEQGLGSIPKSMKMHLSAEDRRLAPSELEPEAKRSAFFFYVQILNQYMPGADEDNWVSLGFCTARNQDEIQWLSHLYALLIERCQFEEFWKAMDESTIVELFKKYKLDPGIANLHNFETLMRDIGKWRQSVWELKKFTQTTEVWPTRSVEVDYGFKNCQNARERLGLRHAYADYFARGEDEMNLHQACIDGWLAQFLTAKLGPLQIPDEVFANDYPGKRCSYNGMTVKSTIVCPESMYHIVLERQKAEGDRELIITVPDEEDEIIKEYIRTQAARTTGRMRVETQTTSHGVEIASMSVDW